MIILDKVVLLSLIHMPKIKKLWSKILSKNNNTRQCIEDSSDSDSQKLTMVKWCRLIIVIRTWKTLRYSCMYY